MDDTSLANEIEALLGALRCARCRGHERVELHPLPGGGADPVRVVSLAGVLDGHVALCAGCRAKHPPRRGEDFVAWGRASGGLADAVLAVLCERGSPMRRAAVRSVLATWGRDVAPERVAAALAALVRSGRAVRVGRGEYSAG